MLDSSFFARDARLVARELLGKVLRRRLGRVWLGAAIVETEAYYRAEKGSHASLGRTPSREALFMPPGTIYMYHSRAGDSLNFSCLGDGNAVLIKAAVPVVDEMSPPAALRLMQRNHPAPDGSARPVERQCAGQTLLCRSLALVIPDWNRRTFDAARFFVDDTGYVPDTVVVARRLGIAPSRDAHLLYRYVDAVHLRSATQNPLSKRAHVAGEDYYVLARGEPDRPCMHPAN